MAFSQEQLPQQASNPDREIFLFKSGWQWTASQDLISNISPQKSNRNREHIICEVSLLRPRHCVEEEGTQEEEEVQRGSGKVGEKEGRREEGKEDMTP